MPSNKVKLNDPIWGQKYCAHIKQLRNLIDEFTNLIYSIRKLLMSIGLIAAIPWIASLLTRLIE